MGRVAESVQLRNGSAILGWHWKDNPIVAANGPFLNKKKRPTFQVDYLGPTLPSVGRARRDGIVLDVLWRRPSNDAADVTNRWARECAPHPRWPPRVHPRPHPPTWGLPSHSLRFNSDRSRSQLSLCSIRSLVCVPTVDLPPRRKASRGQTEANQRPTGIPRPDKSGVVDS